MSRLPSYGKVWNLGHKAVGEVFEDPVIVQAKLDGSQFSFGVVDGELHMRSKRATVTLETADKLFKGATETATKLFEAGKLIEGWVYRGEAIYDKKHNTLTYDRVPKGNIVLFDIDRGGNDMLDPYGLEAISDELGLECVPTIYEGTVESLEELKALMDRESFLGGPKEEGIVIKNYNRYDIHTGKILMAKIVRDEFKEQNKKNWTGQTGVIDRIIQTYANENRYLKAAQRMREEGRLTGEHKDIGPLIGEVSKDVYEECADEIKEILFKEYWKRISRGIISGVPQWYKNKLLEDQFDE